MFSISQTERRLCQISAAATVWHIYRALGTAKSKPIHSCSLFTTGRIGKRGSLASVIGTGTEVQAVVRDRTDTLSSRRFMLGTTAWKASTQQPTNAKTGTHCCRQFFGTYNSLYVIYIYITYMYKIYKPTVNTLGESGAMLALSRNSGDLHRVRIGIDSSSAWGHKNRAATLRSIF